MSVSLLIGDCRERLKELPDGSVNCCVTSPPYFGLRDYGTGQWEGGSADCDHLKVSDAVAAVATSTLGGGKKSTGHQQEGFKDRCGKCGATRIDRQLGLEPTPDEFVAGMVEVFREVRRVLRDDGTLWLNIGDSYSGSGPSGASYQSKTTKEREGKGKDGAFRISKTLEARGLTYAEKKPIPAAGTKAKDLIGIPWLLAFALRADGWYLRQEIIWHKPNPMPESVRDRCTKAHEQIFLLSKSPRYYFDAEAIAEETVYQPVNDEENSHRGSTFNHGKTAEHQLGRASDRPRRSSRTKDDFASDRKRNGSDGTAASFRAIRETRNRRSVWTVATQPFSEAHFATYPPDLIEPCILAGCPKGGTVLDPFGGAGTTGLVADRLGRNAILIELNPDYAAIAEKRLTADAGMFAEVKAA